MSAVYKASELGDLFGARINPKPKHEFNKGDIVEYVNDIYDGMLNIKVGDKGVITKGGDMFVSIKFNKCSAKAFMTKSGKDGSPSIAKVMTCLCPNGCGEDYLVDHGDIFGCEQCGEGFTKEELERS